MREIEADSRLAVSRGQLIERTTRVASEDHVVNTRLRHARHKRCPAATATQVGRGPDGATQSNAFMSVVGKDDQRLPDWDRTDLEEDWPLRQPERN
jgi:hypothetical protein